MKTKLLILSFLINYSVLAQTSSTSALSKELEKLSQNNSLAGFSVAIFNKDKVLYSKGFGFSDKETKKPYTVITVQKIASISKLFLGVSLLKVQELNLLKLDAPVSKYLPFPLINDRIKNSNITIRQLASHTSGLKKNQKFDLNALYFPTKLTKIKEQMPFGLRKILMNIFVRMANKNKNLALQDYLYKIYNPKGQWYSKKHFTKRDAGEKEIYSNQGASFLALAIERASGLMYNDFVKKYIFSELNMTNSGFDFEMDDYPQEKKASLYHNNVKIPNDFKLLLYPAGGIETNMDDFSKFMVAITKGVSDGNSILTKKSCNEMVNLPTNSKISHAVLWETYPSSTIGHQGDMAGVSTYTYYNKNLNKGYILFTNTAGKKRNYKDISVIINTLKDYYTEFDKK